MLDALPIRIEGHGVRGTRDQSEPARDSLVRWGRGNNTTMGRSSATLQPATRPSKVVAQPQTKEGHRDTVEAIVVAFILAVVVRGFEAQAFVIPTGSMAPTLMGRHKEVTCPECGFVYSVNASQEVESHSSNRTVHAGVCVNCRFKARLDNQPSFKGDRILVMMFPYDLPSLPGSGPPDAGTSWCSAIPRIPKPVTSNAWSVSLARLCGPFTATSISSRRAEIPLP